MSAVQTPTVTVLDVLADPDVVQAVDALIGAERQLCGATLAVPDYQADPHAYPRATQAHKQSRFVAEHARSEAFDRMVKVLERRVAELVREEANGR